MAVGIPPPSSRSAAPRDADHYDALGDELVAMSKRVLEIAGELKNLADIIADKSSV
jgi:hypothetical protein